MTSSTPNSSRDYKALERRFTAWARGQAAVRAAVVVGSRARVPTDSHPPDAWSDLDLIVFAVEPAPFAREARWLGEMGEVWLAVPGSTGQGDPEWDVVYAGGLKVDLVLAGVPPGPESCLRDWLERSPYGYVLRRGLRVLFDKSKSGPDLPQYPPVGTELPARDEFAQAVRLGLLAAFNAARFLRRGEVWRFHQQVDCALRGSLLQMLELHARLTRGPAADTWYGGRFLEEWADPRAAALEQIAGPQQALAASLALFRQLARESAERLGYPSPVKEDEAISAWIGQALSETRPTAAPRAPVMGAGHS